VPSSASQTGPDPRPPRARRPAAAIAVLLLAGALAALAIIVAATTGGRVESSLAAAGPAARAGVPAGGEPARLRYRIVGCVSRGEAAIRSGPPVREVAVGFDDGPWADTPEFVTMLERAGVRATFFMIGRQVTSSFRSTLLRELRDGDVLGDHTFTHPELTRSPEVRNQLLRTIAVIRGLTGYTPCVFRPPYGAYDSEVLRTARSLGLSTILWNVDPTDWALPGTPAIIQRVLAQVRPGSIIISHDGGGPRGETLAAYPTIFRDLRARGYRVVTLLELLGYRPVYEPCILLCDGLGVKRSQLPRNAIIRPSA
jgi:peptidoglycan/xylan/chitin deacetylase (PgdA/CDA1 family)